MAWPGMVSCFVLAGSESFWHRLCFVLCILLLFCTLFSSKPLENWAKWAGQGARVVATPLALNWMNVSMVSCHDERFNARSWHSFYSTRIENLVSVCAVSSEVSTVLQSVINFLVVGLIFNSCAMSFSVIVQAGVAFWCRRSGNVVSFPAEIDLQFWLTIFIAPLFKQNSALLFTRSLLFDPSSLSTVPSALLRSPRFVWGNRRRWESPHVFAHGILPT